MGSRFDLFDWKAQVNKDYRAIFGGFTSRKADSWDEIKFLKNPSEEQIEALKEIFKSQPSLKDLSLSTSAFDDSFEPLWFKDVRRDVPIEHIIVRSGRYFYVNTEGYAYARYALEFDPRILWVKSNAPEIKPIEGKWISKEQHEKEKREWQEEIQRLQQKIESFKGRSLNLIIAGQESCCCCSNGTSPEEVLTKFEENFK